MKPLFHYVKVTETLFFFFFFFCHFPFRLGYGNMLSFPVINLFIFSNLPSLVAQMVKNLPAMQETQV